MNGKRPTIVIVDDEVDLQEAIAFDFKRRHFNVLTASCGNEAKKLIENYEVDIVLSDIRMANGSGIELLEWVKARNVFLPVVMFITGFTDITLEEAYDKGADAVFAKPFDRSALFEAVTRVILPLEHRFQRKTTRVKVEMPVGLKFQKSDFIVNTQVRNLGRGGIFVSLNDRFPVESEPVELQIEVLLEGVPFKQETWISGQGVVRWVRENPVVSCPSGCGIEFTHLDPEHAKNTLDVINFLKTRSFIPRK